MTGTDPASLSAWTLVFPFVECEGGQARAMRIENVTVHHFTAPWIQRRLGTMLFKAWVRFRGEIIVLYVACPFGMESLAFWTPYLCHKTDTLGTFLPQHAMILTA